MLSNRLNAHSQLRVRSAQAFNANLKQPHLRVLPMSSNSNLGLALAGVALAIFGISISLLGVADVIIYGSSRVQLHPLLVLGALLALAGFLLALFAAFKK